MSEYRIPDEYFFRIHHVRPRFKGDIENVLIYMAEEISKVGERPTDEFVSAVNAAIYRYPGNAHRELKTINNWRTEISALFGFIEHTATTDKPGRRAIELAERQDLVECFKVFLYNFQYPGAHIKPKNVLEQIEAGVHFKPAQYILKLLRHANKDEENFVPLRTVIQENVDEKYFFSEKAVAGMMKNRESMNKGRAQDITKPCNTVGAHLAKVSLNSTDPVLMENGRYRRFTPREVARIQSFPETFELVGSEAAQYRALGNAIPPVMFWYVANAVSEQFPNEE